jgi:ABC-2 type transport system ATP-binding protein
VAILRIYPKGDGVNGALARQVGETAARENWKVEELHTEEGRLDEVFRNITMPDTAKEAK